MNLDTAAEALVSWFLNRSIVFRVLLTAATTSFAIEMLLRAWGRSTPAYRRWTKVLETVGRFWTAVILGIVYFVPVLLTSLAIKVFGKSEQPVPTTGPETFWHHPPPNPLDPASAARRQF